LNKLNFASSSPLLIVISGPSGVGKDAVLSEMKKRSLPFYYVVTVTTRPKRRGEKDGADYHFVSESEFRQMVDRGELIEWAKVYGNYYGVPRRELREGLGQGKDVILKIDVQGAATIKQILPEAVFIFLLPPSIEELASRLMQRRGLSDSELSLRLSKAQEEMDKLSLFDYVVVSQKDRLDIAVSEIVSIITAEKCRTKQRKLRL
jgi:guanylate kinase